MIIVIKTADIFERPNHNQIVIIWYVCICLASPPLWDTFYACPTSNRVSILTSYCTHKKIVFFCAECRVQ